MVRHKGIIEPSRLPAKWSNSKAVVLLYENTRWYAEKSPTSFRHWINELKDAGIYTIPLQYVSEYVGVSRESVLKRAKTGGLTVFSFIFPEFVKNIFGKSKQRDGKKRVDLVPVSECDQWRDILMDISEYGDFVQDKFD